MSKELLKEIKEHLHQIRSVLGIVGDQETVNRAGELEVLIDEQAERADELEKKNKWLDGGWDTEIQMREKRDKRIDKLQEQNKCYREVIESMKSEINYALHSHKSKEVKRHYLENAVRYANGALEESS